jgi:DNA-binding CsgD family transcriptional regulator/PAS domain-containing protein
MSSESDLASLIALIYEAGMDFGLWPYALGRIATAFNAPSAGITGQGKTLSECWGFSIGVEQEYEQKYVDYYHGVNPIWQRASRTPVGTVQTDTMVMPRAELSRTEFFTDFLFPQQMESQLNAVVLLEGGRQTVVTVRRHAQFEAEHVELYKLLAPHLQRAVQINIKLARAEVNQNASMATLDHLEDGVIFVDLNANVRFANKAAELYFANGELLQRKGRLHTNSASETTALHALIAKSAGSGIQYRRSDFVSVQRQLGKSPLTLLIAPLPSQNSFQLVPFQPMAVVFVNDADKLTKPTVVQLRQKFGMTPAEANFALEISKGDGIQAAADRLSISMGTARTHLSRIFFKTGTRRQAELVRMLISADKMGGRSEG